jgi:hypothetical protein
VLEECRWVADTHPTWLEEYERQLADANDNVWSADFDRLACPFLPICDPVIDGTIVWWDGQHLTMRYSESLADDLGAYLRDNNLIGPGA